MSKLTATSINCEAPTACSEQEAVVIYLSAMGPLEQCSPSQGLVCFHLPWVPNLDQKKYNTALKRDCLDTNDDLPNGLLLNLLGFYALFCL